MSKASVDAMVEGGKASAAPPLGPALGPLGVNIGKVITDINKKTADFKGMQVPITISVDSETKEYEIIVGTPPVSALIKKEAGIEKGSGNPLRDKVADLRIEQIIKIAKMKEDSILGKTLKDKVLEVIGSCNSMGILVGGVPGKDAIKLVKSGKYDSEIKSEKTLLTQEELKELEKEKQKLLQEVEKRRAEYQAKAKEIAELFKDKKRNEIKAKMIEAGIPEDIMSEFLPQEEMKMAKEAARK